MKKLVLAILAIVACQAAYAQYVPDIMATEANAAKAGEKLTWTKIGTPFTTYDFRDTERAHPISLQAWLDSGYYVVIDYSCCWCGPCWTIHNAGILEGYYDRFGPNGRGTDKDKLRVLWVEAESSNTAAQITGSNVSNTYSGKTQGDWTKGGTIPYPMADDRNALISCASLYKGTVPYCVFISPTGYYRSIYGVQDGIYYIDTARCNANIATMMANAPKAGQNPEVELNNLPAGMQGATISFGADIISVDTIVSCTWTFENGTPATANTASATCVWNTPGTYNVRLEVVNTSGTTTKTSTIKINDKWQWGNTMSYATSAPSSALGSTSSTTWVWGAKYPAELMTGRKYLNNVEFYVFNTNGTGEYTLDVYEGGETSPANLKFSRTKNVTLTGWNKFDCKADSVQFTGNQPVWVTFSSSAKYPMGVCAYSGDPNGSYTCRSNEWKPIHEFQSNMVYTWAIKTTTSSNLGISEIGETKLTVYPNPATNVVTIAADDIEEVTILDMSGRKLLSCATNNVDISTLTSGVYTIRVKTATGTAIQKFVKQ